MKYYYRWSFNLSINPIHFINIRIWIGDRNWTWSLNRPFKVERGHIL